jgi:hypothetical protein
MEEHRVALESVLEQTNVAAESWAQRRFQLLNAKPRRWAFAAFPISNNSSMSADEIASQPDAAAATDQPAAA